MRKQNKVVLWPAYFDSTKTRLQGRRISKGLAVISPMLEEVQKAAETCGLQPEVVPDVKHPHAPWQKSGLLFVVKNETKMRIIRRVAKELADMRAQNRI
jgi:signal recognition particle subunit SRP19